MQSIIKKLETQLRQEKKKNRANLLQIKRLQGDLVILGIEPNNTQLTKKLLEEKENTIQMLKQKLKVPGAQHVQYSELTVLQQEKEKIHQEMMDYKGKMLKLQEENKTWET